MAEQTLPGLSSRRDVTIYADGAASPNPGPGGYGTVVLRQSGRLELAGGFRRTTNNRMEILGAIVGLREVTKAGAGRAAVTLYSDSKYLVDMFNGGYAAKWRQQGWTRNKGKDAALNPDLWNELLNLSAGHDVKFVWVRGHDDNVENTRCDELAVKARQGQNLPLDAGYENHGAPQPPQQPTLFGWA
jgi:ribonuclease HI